MHIPKGHSRDTELLSFEEALSLSGRSGGYDSEKWLYVPDFYTKYRYILGTRGKNPLICIGINPSTAEPDNLDNTLKSVERIALFNGFDSFIMFNVYAQRATNPDHMDKAFNRALHEENMNAFRWVLSRSGEEPGIWAAWGTIVEKRAYLKTCLADMTAIGDAFHAKWYQAGKPSKKGHPHHPLYLRKDSKLEDFDMAAYLKAL